MPRKALSLASRQRRLTVELAELTERISNTATVDAEIAAAVACTLPIAVQDRDAVAKANVWLQATADDWTLRVLDALTQLLADGQCDTLATQIAKSAAGDESLLWNLYELLLHANQHSRRTSGTFYTPPQLVRYLVAAADRSLREELNRPLGLADPILRILEPACGSGEFLVALIEHWCRGRESLAKEVFAKGNDNARQRLPTPDHLQRLIAIDLSPVALFIAKLRVALKLQQCGIALSDEVAQPQWICGNALSGPEQIAALREPITVVLGNPPFSYLSRNEEPWIQKLIRGDKQHAGYFAIDDQHLGEKKTWLHDDYVKFLRLAQWCIEQNGSGVLSLVTNHGWLDNATFRIARQQLLRTFDQIDIVDLHGNAKRHEVNPRGERDENVFGIGQGIALVTLTKTSPANESIVSHADLWGSRLEKLQRLERAADSDPLDSQRVVPAAPWFTIAPQSAAIPPEYQAAPLLTELMPVNSTVPVTARDHFVVARTREELLERLQQFCDLRISDDEIRSRFFSRTRSSRYPAGDTRGWKLPAARETVRAEADLNSFIRRCLYRPFVWRYVFWHPAMIDWPRGECTRHMERGNLALLARRQSIAGREANFFWITDCLPLDGVIRSDNRGSESFFPLRVAVGDNLCDRFSAEFPAETLFAYCYALFHSPTYRTRYAAGLAMEFPRVLFPRERRLFDELAQLGQQTIELHLVDPNSTNRLPYLQSEICNLRSAIENFHVGTYNVCRKWLQMEQQSRESPAFAGLQQLICSTLQVQEQIEAVINGASGFPNAFRD